MDDFDEDENVNGDSDVDIIEIDDEIDEFDEDIDDYENGASHDIDNEDMQTVHDDASVIFRKHSGSVFSCDLEPVAGELAVSGGEDDHAYVWNVVNGEVLFKCTDHKDSVTCTSFSHDGKMVATGDMSGLIQVWEVDSKTKIWSFETSDLSWLKWHHGSNVLLAGTMDGGLWMWRLPDGSCKTFTGHGSPTDSYALFPDGKRLVAGYGDGSTRIWDLKSASTLHNITGDMGHKDNVTCIDCYQDDVLVISGSVDGTAKLTNASTGKVLATLQCSTNIEDEADNSVESVGFCRSLPLCATATLDGHLSIWDIPTQVQRQLCRHEEGIVHLFWDNNSPLVYTTGVDGMLRLWDARNGDMAAHWSGHSGEILHAVLSRDGNKILTASNDKTCRVFHVGNLDCGAGIHF